MSDSSSSDAPEEGEAEIRVTSDPDRTEIEQPDRSARERSSMPFRILLVSDLAPESAPEDWSSGNHVHRVDANCFAEFMAERAPRLSLEVRNTLGDTPETWDLELSFSELGAFEPEPLARQVEPLAQLPNVRDLVEKVGDGTIDLDTFRARLDEMGIEMEWADDLYRTLAGENETDDPGEPTGSGGGEGDESLDRLMGMVDVDDGDDEPSPSQDHTESTNGDISSDAVDALMNAVRGEEPGSDASASAVELLSENLNEAVRTQVRPLLQHPKVRQLEAAWRGLKFLVDRLPFRENVELVVLPAGRDDLHEAMHHQVIVPEHNTEHSEPPISLILVDEAFGHDHRDIERLTDLAGTGKSLQTPVVASVDPAFFGMETMSGLRKLPALRPHLQGDEYVEWEGLREDDASQFLALALPPFLLRASYDGTHAGSELPMPDNEGLWGGGALAVGVAAAQSLVDTGWPTHLSEYTVENLPVQSGPGGTSPLSALLPGRVQSELAQAGFTVLSGEANRDRLWVTHVPTVQEPGTYDDPSAAAEARAEASLPCRLFAARAAHRLLEIEKDLDASRSLTALREEIAAAMAGFLNVPVPEEASEEDTDAQVGEQPVSVEHVTDVELPNQEVLGVRVRPPDTILEPNVRLAMALRVPSAA
ncbi:type VI secretion system contractile sheath domain-containing protein [Salinibacter ruber]|uniref:type VI secretion system contractile sheath domain-containing protein n=1 Tax=Salinibacter ruber TaxID=146919 RepID=UPI000E6C1D47|nr:type VI secretion system contractile sheath large subunit [Salinibacter ruber]